jgi:hypothetical protein
VVVAGAIRDSAGDYALAFMTAGWMAIVAGVAVLLVRRPKRASGQAMMAA